MKISYRQAFKACILLSFSAMLFSLHWTGEIKKLINPKYGNLSIVAAVLFFILFLVQLTRIAEKSTIMTSIAVLHMTMETRPSLQEKLFPTQLLLYRYLQASFCQLKY